MTDSPFDPAFASIRHRFTFAVLTDTHLNQSDDECNSPFDVNRRANRRLRWIIDDLNRRDLAFVLHLGDVVHPVPSMEDLYAASARRFFDQFADLRHPWRIIPGNHDVGDKPIDWGPAGTVRPAFLRAWERHFGAQYFHHAIEDIHFIGINAQILGSGLAAEGEQRDWLRSTLDGLRSERIFMGSHYPPFLLDRKEAEHYDNLAPLVRDWLLDIIDEYRVEALFCGHVHQFWYHRILDTDCYLLPSTAFTRQDYSEMFRIVGDDEYGRNDIHKLGYALIHVLDEGHRFEMVHSRGAESGGEGESARVAMSRSLDFESDFEPDIDPAPGVFEGSGLISFDLRQDWCEIVEIPPSGGLDEFDRKRARNDYALLALIEIGAKSLRLPLSDLVDDRRRSRLTEMRRFGFRYRFYRFGPLTDTLCDLIETHADLIDIWETCLPLDTAVDPSLIERIKGRSIEWHLSPLRSRHDIIASKRRYFHVINHGFSAADDRMLVDWLESGIGQAADAYILRLGFDEPPSPALALAQETFERFGKPAVIHLRLTADNPALCIDDEPKQAARLCEVILSAHANPAIDPICDTLSDVDRGYFPRRGLFDRRFNPRPTAYLVQRLNRLLRRVPKDRSLERRAFADSIGFKLRLDQDDAWIVIPDPERPSGASVDPQRIARQALPSSPEVEAIDLIEGVSIEPDGSTENPFLLRRPSSPCT
ncbi:metallophosphoesterase family protein [Thioalkalivibrio sp. HK1]|uniref:metallophosphoesterase family protein n=1 Tax=Thioalkalivibrio sp. HK1 TaxID=1469245 RepID=UPI0006844230|nr:metallophosphoesterase [Thioalkalivibrio sp. HK1]